MDLLGYIFLVLFVGGPFCLFAFVMGHMALERIPDGRIKIILAPLAGLGLLAIAIIGNALILQPLFNAAILLIAVTVRSLLGLDT
jgi:hypothetical protein